MRQWGVLHVSDRLVLSEAVFRFSTTEALGGRAGGLSDLELDANGESFLLLTSHEGSRTLRTPLVVVFDDDRDWKRLFAGHEQSDGLFTVIDRRP